MTVSRLLAIAGCAAGLALPAAAQAQPAPSASSTHPGAAAKPSGASEKEAAGRLAAAGWLTLLDRKDWGRAWETSAGMFRATTPLATWMDGIPKVRAPLGALVDRRPAATFYKTQLAGRPDGDYVSVVFASKFDQQALEEIVTTVREADGKWRVTGYSTR